MKKALQGLKVIEVGNILAGPVCATLMADFGANVIKIETPKTGDLIRDMGRIKNMWFAVEARNKRNITLNLKASRGKELLEKLLRDADILVENFRPGVFERLGFTWEYLQQINPRLIYVCVSGYGQTGPSSHKPGFDRIGLALGGLLHVTGYPDTAPVKPGTNICDFMTAMLACSSAMFAVYYRDIVGTNKGQMIDCCLTETTLRVMESILIEYSYDGTIRNRIGNGTMVTVPSGHFITIDNQYLALSISGDKLFYQFANAIDKPNLCEDPRFNNPQGRNANREELNQIAADWVKSHTIDHCLAKLGEDIPCCKIYSVADIMKDKQFAARNAIVDVSTEEFGKIKMQGVFPVMSETPGSIQWAGGSLGHFNHDIYCDELGLTEVEFEELKSTGII